MVRADPTEQPAQRDDAQTAVLSLDVVLPRTTAPDTTLATVARPNPGRDVEPRGMQKAFD